MTVAIGAVVVLLSVVAGYMLHGGQVRVLVQPSEFLIIGGAGIGSLFIGTPPAVLRHLIRQLRSAQKPASVRADYLDLLTMLYGLLRHAQQAGVMALEQHAEAPEQSPILSVHSHFLHRESAVAFLCDTVRVMVMGGVSTHDLEGLMEEDLEVHHHELLKPSTTLAKVGDALPGLGIVAAVLGVVITMGAIDGSPAEIGHKVAAALVGTFLGVFLAYGFVQPLASSLEHRAGSETKYLECIKAGLLAAHKGLPPAIAVEFARRVLPEEVRPSFAETERACRETRNAAMAAAA
ncbi:MAG: flagellar motor stator protein MotA [Acidobacteriota bacterium]